MYSARWFREADGALRRGSKDAESACITNDTADEES
jgi:hypothetical protein